MDVDATHEVGQKPVVTTPTAVWPVSVNVAGLHEHPLHALRLLLVADVLRRVVENVQGGCAPLAVVAGRMGLPPAVASLARALGIPEPSTRSDSQTFPGGSVQVSVEPGASGLDTGATSSAGRILRIGAVTTRGSEEGSWLGPDQMLHDRDPLALRLALLRVPYSSPIELSAARLHRADETLRRWRFKVAGWHDMPVASAPGDAMEAMRAALVQDVDTGAVLKLLHRLEVDQHVPSGSKFEAFALLDSVLGLDVQHLVGRLRH